MFRFLICDKETIPAAPTLAAPRAGGETLFISEVVGKGRLTSMLTRI